MQTILNSFPKSSGEEEEGVHKYHPQSNDIVDLHPSSSFSLSNFHKEILDSAERFGGWFVYDDIVPLLSEKDWMPKPSTLEREIRRLYQHGFLDRLKKGVYRYARQN